MLEDSVVFLSSCHVKLLVYEHKHIVSSRTF